MAKKPPRRRRDSERSEGHPPQGTLHAKLADPAARQAIQDAGVIFGVNSRTGGESLFFGKATLERILKTGQGKELPVIKVPVDFRTDDPEVLAAACLTLKGSHCYQIEDGEDDPISPGLN